MGIDPLYYLFTLPALVLSMIFSARVKSTFAKYAKVRASTGLTGAQAAATMLARSGVHDVEIRQVSGFLTDHYNPADNTLNLSRDVYAGHDLAALGVACHEAGHALQKATNYRWMGLRTALVPAANLGSRFSMIVFFAGMALSAAAGPEGPASGGGIGPLLVKAGIVMFCGAVAFSLVTLPVEWDASARAKRQLVACGLLAKEEERGAAAVLNAAFMTYIGAAISSLLTLLYFLVRSGLLQALLGGRRNDR